MEIIWDIREEIPQTGLQDVGKIGIDFFTEEISPCASIE